MALSATDRERVAPYSPLFFFFFSDHFQSKNVVQTFIIRMNVKSQIKDNRIVSRVMSATEIEKDSEPKKKKDNCEEEGSDASDYFHEKDKSRY